MSAWRRGRIRAAPGVVLCLLCAGAAPSGAAPSGNGERPPFGDDGPMPVAPPESNANLALLARDRGRHEEALTHWVKGSLETGAGGFVWNQRGWAYAALKRIPEARDSFLKAGDRSSTTADQVEAKLGLGLVARMAAQPRQALTLLRAMLGASPFIMAAASCETAKAALGAGDRHAAIAYLRQCVSLDPLNLECLKELAELHARMGENRAAWHAYLRVLDLDPADTEAARQVKKLRASIPGDPEAALPLRRLARTLLPPEPSAGAAPQEAPSPKGVRSPLPEGEPAPASSVTVRVALFTAPDGRPATATRLYFICNSDFKIIADSGDVVKAGGQAGQQWEIAFRPESSLVELRDGSRNVQYETAQGLRIVPGGRQSSVLLRSVRFMDGVGIDAGDRELRGIMDILPTPYGFKLVNEVGLEEYLYGVVAAALPQGSPSEAYQAQAVVSRTQALWSKAHRPENPERADVCDSAACQKYLGLSAEMQEATTAVQATSGAILTRNGTAALVLQHDNCGGVTEDGLQSGAAEAGHLVSVSDGPGATPLSRAPDQLELWTHEYPPADRYCEASGLTAPVESRWVRILAAADLAARAERIRPLGAIRHLRAAKRTATGRVHALEVTGSKGTVVLEGEKAISDFLSPGSLRSTLFTVQPLMAGGKADRFILWGAGTGHGVGFCRAGALGQASMGRKWQAILGHYFPNLQVALPAEKLLQPAPAAARSRAPRRNKPKNPSWKKKQ